MFRETVSNELFTLFLIIGLIFVAITKLIAPKRFSDFIYVLGNSKYLKIYARDQKFFDKFEALLFFNLLLSSSVFAIITFQIITGLNINTIDYIIKITFAIAAFILIKVLIERLIGSLFEIDRITDLYLFQKITYKNFLGLILIPIDALLLYSFKPSLIFIYLIIIFLLIINLIGLITTIKSHQTLIKGNFFYFILYLCALEIAPYIILYKVLVS